MAAPQIPVPEITADELAFGTTKALPPLQLRVGHRLKEIRLAMKLTQDQLGIATDYDRKYVSEVERGTQWPPHDWMMRLAEVYGIRPDYLLLGDVKSLRRELHDLLLDYRKSQNHPAQPQPRLIGLEADWGD